VRPLQEAGLDVYSTDSTCSFLAPGIGLSNEH
jgi:hypothetical protein